MAENIVLKDRSGANVTYEVPNGEIKLNTPSGTQIFTAGQAVDNVPVTLDFADGDQTVTAGEGQLIKSAVIQKPATLSPANIVKDVNIAGVVGTFERGGSDGEWVLATGSITGNGSNMVVTHGLGVVPDLILVRINTIGGTLPTVNNTLILSGTNRKSSSFDGANIGSIVAVNTSTKRYLGFVPPTIENTTLNSISAVCNVTDTIS